MLTQWNIKAIKKQENVINRWCPNSLSDHDRGCCMIAQKKVVFDFEIK